MTSKKELRSLKALDQIAVLINVRESLARIRENNIEEAVNSMEMYLDCTISALARDIDGCDAVTKDLMEQEFRRLSLYQKTRPDYPGSYLDRFDPDLREGMMRIRAEAKRILKQYSS